MKKKLFYTSLFLATSVFFSCEPKECEEGYTRVGHDNGTTCLPIVADGMIPNPELGTIFYHEKHGVITFKNNKWFNEHNIEVEILIEK